MTEVHLGISFPAEHSAWPVLRDLGQLVDELGYDSLWTQDHFMPLEGNASGPIFEAWQVLAAWGASTRRVGIGTLVTGNTYRHPAILTKSVVTLDHVTGGRAILGLGAAWHEEEHAMYGIPFDTPGTRLQKLAESARMIRSLLEQPQTTIEGRHYHLVNALSEPKPIQPRLPLLIGGKGEKKTMRIAAQYADMWHGSGSPELIAHKLDVLRAHCASFGRDVNEILPLITLRPAPVLRDTPSEIESWRRQVAEANGMTALPAVGPQTTSEALAQSMAEYCRLGIRGFVFEQPAPYDRETIERIAREVRPRLNGLIGEPGRGS